ncbi:MAG: hypothetical protein PVI79_00970 [Gammaproteobacteria bacterium]|jgi:hypothetical protein
MKLFAKLMLATLVLAMLLPFTILKDDSGKTLMSFSDFEWPDFSAPSLPKAPIIDSISESAGNTGGKNTVYKWFDSEGSIQFTTDPPPEGIEFEVRNFDPDVNVIEPVKPPSGDAPAAKVDDAEEDSATPVDPGFNAYSPDSVKKLFDKARNVEKLLTERFQSQESAINQ